MIIGKSSNIAFGILAAHHLTIGIKALLSDTVFGRTGIPGIGFATLYRAYGIAMNIMVLSSDELSRARTILE